MMIEGITRLGAKLNICPTYKTEDMEVILTENISDRSIPHNDFMELALLDSSPEEYFLKNLAGKDNNLDITAASTDSDTLLEILPEIIELEAPTS